MTKKYILSAALCAFCLMHSGLSFAQDSDAMGFASIARSPRAAAMGFAGKASLSQASWSSFTSSAILPFYEGKADAGVSYQMWAPNGVPSNNIAAGAALKLGESAGFSVGFARGSGESYYGINANGVRSREPFTPSDMQIDLGFGMSFSELIGAGLNVKMLSNALASDAKYNCFAADLFTSFKFDALSATVGLSNLGTSISAASGDSFSAPASVSAAAAYKIAPADAHAVEALLDIDYYLTGGFALALGAEYAFKDMVFVRAGYHLGSGASPLPSFATVGAGFKFAGVRLEAAYLTANEFIGNTLTFGLGYSF